MARVISNPFLTNKYVQVGHFRLMSTGALRLGEKIYLSERKRDIYSQGAAFWELLQAEAIKRDMSLEELVASLDGDNVSVELADLVLALEQSKKKAEQSEIDYALQMASYLMFTRLDPKQKPLLKAAYKDQGLESLDTVEDFAVLINLLPSVEAWALIDFFVEEEMKGDALTTDSTASTKKK